MQTTVNALILARPIGLHPNPTWSEVERHRTGTFNGDVDAEVKARLQEDPLPLSTEQRMT